MNGLSKCDKILNAHFCYNELNASSNDCEKCSLGYGYLDDHGDNPFWTCDSNKLMKDIADLLSNTKGCLSIIAFMLNEYSKPDSEKHVEPFKTTEDMAKYFSLMVSMINKDYNGGKYE